VGLELSPNINEKMPGMEKLGWTGESTMIVLYAGAAATVPGTIRIANAASITTEHNARIRVWFMRDAPFK
jgi:hypothetical protein